MLRRLKQHIVDRLGITRVASSADHSLRSMQEIRLWREVELTSQVMAVTAASATTVSVVMATRNRRSLCRRAIGSVLAQRHAEWQLVVIDDGSDDGTSDVASEFPDRRITWLRTDGIGASAARNVGL
ncbi:MAG: glycosyltransferase family 2 protein, partial [Ilumatobacteraceae bacterium]